MGKKTKKRLSCFLCAMLLFVTGIETSAFTGVFAATARKIDVWDFGAVQESDTQLYNNHISAQDWEQCENVSSAGKFAEGTTVFGDLTLTHTVNDRLFSTSSKNYGTNALAKTAYADGYTAGGMYYCNGTGGEGRRNITIANVEAGDKIVVYMASSNAVTGELVFTYLGEDGTQKDTESFTNVGTKYEFIAQYSGSYKIYTTAAAGKPIYNRVMRIPAVTVSGTIELNGVDISGCQLLFMNKRTNTATQAKLNGNSYSVSLAAGEEYTAVLSGVTGIGFTNDTKVVTTDISEVLTGKENVSLKVETKSVYTYTGKISGFTEGYDISKLKVTMEPAEGAMADAVELKIAEDFSFTAVLEPDVEYTASLQGVNDYEIISGKTVNDNQNHTEDIIVAAKAVYAVNGEFTGLEAGTNVTELTFTNVDDNYVYAGTVTNDGYEISLRNGAYAVSAAADGYRTTTHVVVNGAAVKKDILFVSTAAAEPMTRVPDLYVGYEDKAEYNYNTVKEAVAAAAAMNPSSEEERITIHIAPGTYREQVIITTPYLSLVNDSDKEVLMTWYYGIGYEYYSADGTGYYNVENAYDQYAKSTASKWGCAVYVKNTATGFSADGIVFENSFNRYLTDEEIEDGVTPAADTGLPQRKYGTDVASKAATERATAMAVEADKVEFTNCAFLGSQDTLYTGNSATSLYFKNCRIEGNTDYIFGDGDCVFDGCELKWYGYSTNSVGGYITAHKPTSDTKNGYLFRNCVITANDELTVTPGYFGRPWGADAHVTFLNTKLAGDFIVADGWTEMSGKKPENAKYNEFNTTRTDGTEVDLSARVTGIMSEDTANAVDVTAYFNGWTPKAYTKEADGVAFTRVPYVVDNGDINAPYPGHKLTVGYSLGEVNDAGDASVIRWYIVADDGTETLSCSSTANADKSFTIPSEAEGKHIKVVVIPQTISGTTGEAAEYKVEAFVREGYEDPSSTGSDIELGKGVNIFLAGDSTVKDYSANGMYMSGKAQAEGSWGEYLQSFFDDSKVKVVNYANGGRSSRNFINEGSLDKIAENIKAGDYLIIQFGHNDCSNQSGYLEDRYVPLGTPDENGIYPTTAGTKVATPSTLTDKYGDTFYSYDCGGTYKWYLQQYIEVAKAAGAKPVLVTPVSRLYYTADGTIKAHHDSTDTTTGTLVTENNAYVTAVKQLAEEQNVLLMDAFELTKTMYETAYANDTAASNGVSEYGTQVMAQGDKTHSNKLGGFLTSAMIAQQLQNMDLTISSAVKMPSQVAGNNPDGQQTFTVNGKNQLKAYIKDADGNYTKVSEYWTKYGQTLITEIGEKHEELSKPSEPDTPSEEQATVWVVGDSTVCSFTDAYYYPRYGWGTQLSNYFDSTLKVENLALSGRSSKSFATGINENGAVDDSAVANYTQLKENIKAGDTLIIAWGHNDEKTDSYRFTDPNGDKNTAGSFKNSLYENYIKLAQDKGATPILCTPIVRRTASGAWGNNDIHIANNGDYAQAVRDLGTELGITVIDSLNNTKSLYDTVGVGTAPKDAENGDSETVAPTGSAAFHATDQGLVVDNTHLNDFGATMVAYMMAKDIQASNTSLASHVANLTEPTVDMLTRNAGWAKFNEGVWNKPEPAIWKLSSPWEAMAFGSGVSGITEDSHPNHDAIQKDATTFEIVVRNNKGKIAGSEDGMMMAFQEIGPNDDFTLTATATVGEGFKVGNQIGFGLICRDNMFIADNYKTKADYVTAGYTQQSLNSVSTPVAPFARLNGSLDRSNVLETAPAAGDSIELKLTRKDGVYTAQYGNNTPVTYTDVNLAALNAGHDYVGMFVSRNADITFSNVSLTVDAK